MTANTVPHGWNFPRRRDVDGKAPYLCMVATKASHAGHRKIRPAGWIANRSDARSGPNHGDPILNEPTAVVRATIRQRWGNPATMNGFAAPYTDVAEGNCGKIETPQYRVAQSRRRDIPATS